MAAIWRPAFSRLAGQLMHAAMHVDIGDPFYDQLTAVKSRYSLTSATWPYRGLRLGLIEEKCFFFKLTADKVVDFHWIAGSSVSQTIRTSKRTGALLLGLAKSIYYWFCVLVIYWNRRDVISRLICIIQNHEYLWNERRYQEKKNTTPPHFHRPFK